uniref:Uncharacterized protein n=1 Tax=Kalanchoe fedtschenkoi TaxID=63787 RepID=A0A7N0R966_KALFE
MDHQENDLSPLLSLQWPFGMMIWWRNNLTVVIIKLLDCEIKPKILPPSQ